MKTLNEKINESLLSESRGWTINIKDFEKTMDAFIELFKTIPYGKFSTSSGNIINSFNNFLKVLQEDVNTYNCVSSDPDGPDTKQIAKLKNKLGDCFVEALTKCVEGEYNDIWVPYYEEE